MEFPYGIVLSIRERSDYCIKFTIKKRRRSYWFRIYLKNQMKGFNWIHEYWIIRLIFQQKDIVNYMFPLYFYVLL